ncbi:hypothetical protein LP414_27795 [Polaromonas sp. P1(28)-13]|nr:hypothetical protein LP414_27795 [Polaromonas sp. P1(28)-13]
MEYNRYATAVSAAYEVFSSSLTPLYLQMKLDGASRTSNAPLLKLRVDGHQLMNSFLERAETLTADYLSTIVPGALTSAPDGSRAVSLLRALRVISYNNVVSLIQKTNADVGSMLSTRGGAMGALALKASNTVTFTSQDSSGRTWQSAVLVKTLSRDFAYQTFIDGQVKTLRAQGATTAQISYLDPLHENHGLVVAITGAGIAGVPNMESVRDTIFHINANANLTHVQT